MAIWWCSACCAHADRGSHPSRNTSLMKVSVATFLSTLLLAFIASDSTGEHVAGATAAYATVLVISVGITMAPSS